MRVAHVGLVALTLASGCLRVGYDESGVPDAAQNDGAAAQGADGAVVDAAAETDAAGGGVAGRGGAGAGSGGSGAGSGGADAGTDREEMIGDAGLRVSDILGFYSGDWGDMVLREQHGEIWGAYARDGGTIVGEITGEGIFVGWWSQLPSRAGSDAGEVEFRWTGTTGTAVALDGRWRYGTSEGWLENWDIDLVTDRAAPSELTARFDSPSEFVRHP